MQRNSFDDAIFVTFITKDIENTNNTSKSILAVPIRYDSNVQKLISRKTNVVAMNMGCKYFELAFIFLRFIFWQDKQDWLDYLNSVYLPDKILRNSRVFRFTSVFFQKSSLDIFPIKILFLIKSFIISKLRSKGSWPLVTEMLHIKINEINKLCH